MSAVDLVGWFGAVTALLGTGLLCVNRSFSGWGFVAYLASNLAWIGFALHVQAWHILVQQVGFTATSLIGIYCWLLKKPAAAPA